MMDMASSKVAKSKRAMVQLMFLLYKDQRFNPKPQRDLGAEASLNCKNCGRPQSQGVQGRQAQGYAQCINRFYVVHDLQDVEETLHVVTAMLKVFNFDVYALLDSGANLSFVTPFLANRFNVCHKVLL